MDKLDIQEKLLGGIFGVISIAAAVAETITGGIDTAAIFGMIKDISGTLVVVVVMLAVAKMLVPLKYNKSFEDRLNAALDKWVENNSNMIVKGDKYGETPENNGSEYRLSMRVNLNEFYRPTSTGKIGVFLKMPLIRAENYNKNGVILNFELKKSVLVGNNSKITEEEWKLKLSGIGSNISAYINSKFSGFAQAVNVADKINVTLANPVFTDKEISQLIDLINTMYNAYLVASHIEVK